MNTNTNTTKRAAVYGRVSLDTGSASVTDQVRIMQEACEAAGYTVTHVLRDEGIGASRYSRGERPDFAELRELIRTRQVQAVGVWEPSRLSRDLGTAVSLRDDCEAAGVLLITSGGTYDMTSDGDRLALGVGALVAEQEARAISKRTTRGSDSRALAGRPNGKNNYGFARVYGPTGKLSHVVHVEEEAAILRRAAAHVVHGGSLSSMVKALNDEGVPSPDAAVAARTGRKPRGSGLWTIAGLRSVLASPASAGLRVHRGEIVGLAAWEPIITAEQRTKLLATFDARRVGKRRGGVWHWPSGLLECAVCGEPLRLTGKVDDVAYWQCAGRHAGIKDEAIRLFLRDLIVAAVTGYGRTRPVQTDSRIQAAKDALEAAQERQKQAVAAYAAGRLPLAVLEAVSDETQSLVRELRDAVAVLDAPAVEVDQAEVLHRWDSLAPEKQREIARTVLGRVIVTPAGKGNRWIETVDRVVLPDLAQAA